jgi:hypothetical protein
MVAQMATQFFVKFAPFPQMPDGFKAEQDYPVFGIDVIDLDDGSSETKFLLADSHGIFRWILSDSVRRVAPHRPQTQQNNRPTRTYHSVHAQMPGIPPRPPHKL